MNNTHRQFAKILSDTIRENKSSIIYDDMDWDNFIDLTKENNCEKIIYHGLNKSKLVTKIKNNDNDYLENKILDLDKETSKYNDIYLKILRRFNEENIKTIFISDVIIRGLYTDDKLRDIKAIEMLIKEDELEVVKDILMELNYKHLYGSLEEGMQFSNKDFTVIKLYTNIFNVKTNLININKQIWKKSIKLKIEDLEAISLCYEDLALYICKNIKDALSNNSYIFDKLCDFVLLVEKQGEDINWDSFIMKASMYGFERLSIILMVICNKFFDMEIPKEISINEVNNKRYVNAFIDEVMGIDLEIQAKSIIEDTEACVDKEEGIKVKEIISIKWVKKIMNNLLAKDMTISEKIKAIKGEPEAPVNKEELMEWMEL